MRRGAGAAFVAGALVLAAGCVTLGEPDLRTHECSTGFTRQLADVLRAQGEPERLAQELARDATMSLLVGEATPARFYVFSPSGRDYSFFVQKKATGCVLRLDARRSLHVEVTNDLTYIASRPLPGCACR